MELLNPACWLHFCHTMSARKKHGTRPNLNASPASRSTGNARRIKLAVKLTLFAIVAILMVSAWHLAKARKELSRPPVVFSTSARDTSTDSAQSAPKARSASAANEELAFAAQFNRGTDLLAQGKPAEAAEVLAAAARLNPDDEDVHYNLGVAMARLGKYDEAILQYREALRIFPNYTEAHNNLGNVLMRVKKLDEAIRHFERAIELMPDYASAHNNLGTALQRSGDLSRASTHFSKAVELNPDYWQARFNLAVSYLQSGKRDDARRELQTVVRMQPEFEPAKSALAELEK